MRNRELYSRLHSCLQTILDLEEDLESCNLAGALSNELRMLRGFMDNIKEMELAERDVARIEAATAHFLENLNFPFMTLHDDSDTCKRIQ